MTAIVGMVDKADGSVWVMGDSAASNGSGVWVQKDPKVWTHGELAMGFCGSFRGRDILATNMDLPVMPPDMDAGRYLRTEFVAAVREAMRKGGFLSSFREGNDLSLSSLMVGTRGRLFVMRNDFSIGEENSPFTAIGSGADHALGSLYSTRQWPDVKSRLTEALNASTYYTPSVRPPFNHVKTPPWPTT